MTNDDVKKAADSRTGDATVKWYNVLTAFPFLYLPVVAIVGIVCAWIMPVMTGASHR